MAKRLTDDEKQFIINRRKEGATIAEVALEVGFSTATVSAVCKKMSNGTFCDPGDWDSLEEALEKLEAQFPGVLAMIQGGGIKMKLSTKTSVKVSK